LKQSDGSFALYRPKASPTSSSPAVVVFDADSDHGDHGTHVAGILAAAPVSPAPGLIPGAELVLVDTRSSSTLFESMADAIRQGVAIFNFSCTFDLSTELNKAILQPLHHEWADRLIVAAAGNDGMDTFYLNAGPITWNGAVPNIVGVAASDSNHHLLSSYVD